MMFRLRWTTALVLAAVCVLQGTCEAVAQPAGRARRPAADLLLDQVDRAIDLSSRRYLDVEVHTPWQIIHGILALRQDFLVMHQGKRIRALDWMSDGAEFRGTPWFHTTPHGGRAQPFTEPQLFEGHPNQFLGYLTMCDLPLDYEIRTGEGRTITIADIVRNTQMDVQIGEEVSWTLWGLVHYLEPDATWMNKRGEAWSIERLVRSQNYENVTTAACGGTHGLFALAYAREKYLETGRPLRGVWLEADQKIRRYVEEARVLQNPDGSFSASFFQGRNHSRDPADRIGATGHILEFLMMALPDERLDEPWVRNAIASLARDLMDSGNTTLDCGPLYHAVHALVMYRGRVRPRLQPEVQVVETEETASTGEREAPVEASPTR